MTQTEIEKLVKKQRDFFNSGETLNVSFRISALEKLRACISNQMIISKNPQFTGISARQQLEFTTHLLLTD